jgi:MFS family permease
MRFAIQVLLIMIFSSILELLLPWWSVAFAAFIGGVLVNSRSNFLAGFFGVGLLWAITSVIIDITASSDLTERVASVFMLNKPLLFLVTALLGGLVGGFAAMAGGALRKERNKVKYY